MCHLAMLCCGAVPADKDADAVADTADSYGEDPLPPPVRPPPPTAPTPGEVQSGSHLAGSRWPRSCHHCPRHHRRRRTTTTTAAVARRGAGSCPPPPPASPPVAVAEAAPAEPHRLLQWPSLRRRHPGAAAGAPARCLQLPSTSVGVTARGGIGASCTSPPVAMALPPPASLAAAPSACCWRWQRWRC